MEAIPDSTPKSSLNMKEIATSIAVQMLKHAHHEAVIVHSKQIIEFARKWGATVPPDLESQAINELRDWFPEPATWPTIKVATETGTLSTSTASAPRGRPKQDSDPEPKSDGAKLKAADFADLKIPDGVSPPLCPVEIKQGDRKGQSCGKVCKKVLPEHDPEDPKCAKLECNHAYCGTHITKAQGSNSGAARKRLEKAVAAATSGSDPVTVTEEGKTTTLNTGVLDELKPATTSGAGKAALSKIFEKVKARKEAAGKTDGDEANSNN